MTPAGTQPGYDIGRDDSGLTKREREVIAGIVAGQALVQIAAALGVTKQRVDTIVRSLIQKDRLRRTDGHFEVIVPR